MLNRWLKQHRLDLILVAGIGLSLALLGMSVVVEREARRHLHAQLEAGLTAMNRGASSVVQEWLRDARWRSDQLAESVNVLEFAESKMTGEPADSTAVPEIVISRKELNRTRRQQLEGTVAGIVNRRGKILARVSFTNLSSHTTSEFPVRQLAFSEEALRMAFVDRRTAVGAVTSSTEGRVSEGNATWIYVLSPLPVRIGAESGLCLVMLVDPSETLLQDLEAFAFGNSGRNDLIARNNAVIGAASDSERRPRPSAANRPPQDGIDLQGYRGPDGELLIGSWQWLADGEIGVVTEQSATEAFSLIESVGRLQWWCKLGLLTLCLIWTPLVVVRLRQSMGAEDAEPPPSLGPYHLQRVIGRGGMGTVYLAQHQLLRRRTAVKVIRGQHLSRATIARFEREAKLSCQLRHPNTVSIFDFGNPEEDVFYYAMEYIDGLTLQQLIEHYGPVVESRTILLIKQLCNALHEAHEIGLIHRDVKPANIMITQASGMADFVKLLDFGLVKGLNLAEPALTGDNVIAGTPEYVSPEAIEDPRLVDARSDIYSLGGVAYFLLTGRPVFEGTSSVAVCMQRLIKSPEPPSAVLKRAIDPDLESLIMDCLSRNPADRPQTVREVKLRLEKCSTARDWSFERAEEWWIRHRAAEAEHTAEANIETNEFGEAQETLIVPAERSDPAVKQANWRGRVFRGRVSGFTEGGDWIC